METVGGFQIQIKEYYAERIQICLCIVQTRVELDSKKIHMLLKHGKNVYFRKKVNLKVFTFGGKQKFLDVRFYFCLMETHSPS